ncbi:MAG TPA: phytoene desaturase family protein [Bacteroidales bacterium]|nr:phytoene desaturase family protein [Bacteroidales bacterium]HRW96766.1 phytoene desaturase family protein [Bacteroidales bacterium]
MNKKVTVIGAGFSGISAATGLADKGFDVTVLEKNSTAGGRARKFSADGFTFDMGPSWYWMPDVFDSYFASFGKKVSDYYDLQRLDPSYRIFFGKEDIVDLPADLDKIAELFESFEKGAGQKLKIFLAEAEFKYEVAMKDFVSKPSLSFLEYADMRLLKAALRMHMFTSFHHYTRKYFSHPRLLQMLEFPILFLGGTGKKTPALYSLMNYGDMKLGTWYPRGGMFKVVEAMVNLAEEKGVKFVFNAPVTKFIFNGSSITETIAGDKSYPTDYVVATGDYHHIEQELLPVHFRKYSEKYWESRVMSPASLLWYVGLNKKLEHFLHHTLLFDEEFAPHAGSIYEKPGWPEKPSIYVSVTSKSDPHVAPEGHENIFFLIPVAPGLQDSPEIMDKYFSLILRRVEKMTGENLEKHIVFRRPYSHTDFIADYNAFKGNAYGLANTLLQTAFLKPSAKSSKVKNLVYAGQLTVPGPGVPPAIISGQIATRLIVETEK